MRGTILVAEDEAVVACDLLSQLENLGRRVGAVTTSDEEALDFVRVFRPDLILLDERVSSSSRGSAGPVVFLTGMTGASTGEFARSEQPDTLFVTPLSLDDVLVPQASSSPSSRAEDLETVPHELDDGSVRFRRLLDSSFLGFCITDFNHRVFDANESLLTALGHSRDDVIRGTVSWASLITTDRVPAHLPILERMARGEHVEPFRSELLDSRGGELPVTIWVSSLQGHHDRALAILIDESDRRAAAVDAPYSQRQRQMLAHFAQAAREADLPGPLFDAGARFMALAVGADVCRIVESRAGDDALLQRASFARGGGRLGLHLEGDPVCRALFLNSLLTGAALVSDDLSKDERYPITPGLAAGSLLSAACVPYALAGGGFGAIQAFSRGCGAFGEVELHLLDEFATVLNASLDRLAAQGRVDEISRDCETLLDSFGQGLLRVDDRGLVRFVSPSACRLTGWSLEDLVGRSISGVLTPLGLEDEGPTAAHAVTWLSRPRHVTSWILAFADGTARAVECMLAPVAERGRRTGTLLAFRLCAAGSTQSGEAEGQRTVRLQALEQLASDAANDIDAVLSVVESGLHTLRGAGVVTSIAMRALERMDGAARKGVDLMRRLRAFGQRQVTVERALELNAVITYLEPNLRLMLGADVTMDVHLEPGLHKVEAEPRSIEHLVLDLARNARSALPQGGRFTLTTSNVAAGTFMDDECVMIMVSMVSSDDPRAESSSPLVSDEPFVSYWKRDEEEIGRQSALNGQVRQLGGMVDTEEFPDGGALTRVILPAHRTDPDGSGCELRASEKILLLHAALGPRSLIHSILQRNGYTVLEAWSEREALAICELHEGDIHLLVTETEVQGTSGRKIAKRVTAVRPDIKVLLLGSYADYALALQAGDDLDDNIHVVEKPVTWNGLLSWVREVLDGEG